MVNASRIELPDAPTQQRADAVRAWREDVAIDTYLPRAPDRYPAYLDDRVYQGSSGQVYPLPFHERISQEKVSRSWDAIHLENEWVRLMILPELGGRVHVGIDKTRDYDFFYRNNVIKPALVGLAGPWVSGGVELNWPQHHRPATFLPTAASIEHEPDGAVTVWCSDHDPFARMKGMHGFRLRPDSSVIELRARLYNRSEHEQTFMWWANVAAHANDDYQSFFPTDVHREVRGGAVVLRPVELHAAGHPRPRQPDQGGLDHGVGPEQVAAAAALPGHVDAPAELRQHDHAQPLVLQVHRAPGPLVRLVGDLVVERQRVHAAGRPLVHPPVQVCREPVRGQGRIGGQVERRLPGGRGPAGQVAGPVGQFEHGLHIEHGTDATNLWGAPGSDVST